MNDEQHGLAPFQAQPCGTGNFWPLRRYFSLMCSKHIALEMPCSNTKIAASLRSHPVLAGPARTLPPAADFLLTRRLPCAALALLMFASVFWLPLLLGPLGMLPGMMLHLLTPALFALILLGGGFNYALQVAGIATLAVLVASGLSLVDAAFFFALYALLPIMSAVNVRRPNGIGRAGRNLAIGLFAATLASLWAEAATRGVTLPVLAGQMLEPFYGPLIAGIPPEEKAALEQLQQMREITAWAVPGLTAFSLWLVWWLDAVFARWLACRYGFYRGDCSPLLRARFGKGIGIAALAALVAAVVTDGSLQYVAVSAGLMLAGMMAAGGISVVHLWLKERDMELSIFVMYMLLLLPLTSPMVIIPLIIVGLLDIWFDFRRNIVPAPGGK